MTAIKERADLARIALLVAEEAAALALGGYRNRPRADKKGQHDLVTEFDRSSEELVRARLASLAPGIPVIGEEGGGTPEPGRRGLVWYVDPIDGTTNFVHGHPFWCVAVGLMEDDLPIAGAVVAPAIDVKWIGWVGESESPEEEGYALRNGRRCRVSSVATLDAALVATGFPANRDRAPQNNFDSFVAVERICQAARCTGSAAIDLCMVADGTYDAYWYRKLSPWDTAGAGAILLAAHGVITALDGDEPNYHVGHIVASNGLVHDELLRVLSAPL